MSSELSIIVPTYGRAELCKRNLLSLHEALCLVPSRNCEIIVGVNGRDPETSEVLNQLLSNHLESKNFRLKIMEFEEMKNPSTIRNRLVEKADGHWIYFSDDDAYVERDFFQNFFRIQSSAKQADVIGGPNLTPPNSNIFQKASGITLSSRLATYFSSARYKKKGIQRACDEQSLILCNLFVRREAMLEQPFLDELVCAEENWLLQYLKKRGKLLLYEPNLSVWHDRRPNLATFCRQVFKYGYGRGQILRKSPRTFNIAHTLPTVSLVYSLTLLILLLSGIQLAWAWAFPFAFYLILCLWASAASSGKEEKLKTKLLSASLFPMIHIFYGSGLCWGFLQGTRK